jgi:thiosulfate/3-mercaptopyruvate sulfurtransferase
VPGNITPAVLIVHPRPALIIEMPAVRQAVSSRSIAIIDARSPTDYSGANGNRRSGHIPGAKNVLWQENLASRDNPVLRSASELRARYISAGIKPRAEVIVYCQSGIQAAYDYFTLKLTGFRPVLYDASFAEWSNEFSAPIETGR